MVYSEFSTKNADYQLYLHHPWEKIKEKVELKGLDAIVLGLGSQNFPDPLLYNSTKEIIEKAKGTMPIFIADSYSGIVNIGNTPVHISDISVGLQLLAATLLWTIGSKITRRKLIKACAYSLATALIIYPASYISSTLISGREGRQDSLISAISYGINANPESIIISATNAKKIEEIIVPLVKKTEKPRIALFYPSNKVGVESFLLSKELREFVINAFASTGYLGIDKERISKIKRYEWATNRWEETNYSLHL